MKQQSTPETPVTDNIVQSKETEETSVNQMKKRDEELPLAETTNPPPAAEKSVPSEKAGSKNIVDTFKRIFKF